MSRLAVVLAALFFVALVAGVVIVAVTVSSIGAIKAVGIDVSQSEINWGLIGRGENKTYVVTVSNVNNTAVQLSLRVENWSPLVAADYLSLGWNCSDVVLHAGDSVQAAFTLRVADVEVPFSTFRFDIVIVGTEAG